MHFFIQVNRNYSECNMYKFIYVKSISTLSFLYTFSGQRYVWFHFIPVKEAFYCLSTTTHLPHTTHGLENYDAEQWGHIITVSLLTTLCGTQNFKCTQCRHLSQFAQFTNAIYGRSFNCGGSVLSQIQHFPLGLSSSDSEKSSEKTGDIKILFKPDILGCGLSLHDTRTGLSVLLSGQDCFLVVLELHLVLSCFLEDFDFDW